MPSGRTGGSCTTLLAVRRGCPWRGRPSVMRYIQNLWFPHVPTGQPRREQAGVVRVEAVPTTLWAGCSRPSGHRRSRDESSRLQRRPGGFHSGSSTITSRRPAGPCPAAPYGPLRRPSTQSHTPAGRARPVAAAVHGRAATGCPRTWRPRPCGRSAGRHPSAPSPRTIAGESDSDANALTVVPCGTLSSRSFRNGYQPTVNNAAGRSGDPRTEATGPDPGVVRSGGATAFVHARIMSTETGTASAPSRVWLEGIERSIFPKTRFAAWNPVDPCRSRSRTRTEAASVATADRLSPAAAGLSEQRGEDPGAAPRGGPMASLWEGLSASAARSRRGWPVWFTYRFPAAAVLPSERTVSPVGGRRHVQQPFGDLPVLHERDP